MIRLMFSTGKAFMPNPLWALKLVADFPHDSSLQFSILKGIWTLRNYRWYEDAYFSVVNCILWNRRSYQVGYIIGWRAWFLT
jgi:hypothetical protein